MRHTIIGMAFFESHLLRQNGACFTIENMRRDGRRNLLYLKEETMRYIYEPMYYNYETFSFIVPPFPLP